MVRARHRRRRVRRVVGPRVHAGRVRAARRAHRALQAARGASTSVRDAHAQRRRPAHRSDRRIDRRRARRRMSVTDLSSQDAGSAQLGQARHRVRAHRGRARAPAATRRSIAIRTSRIRRGSRISFPSGAATTAPARSSRASPIASTADRIKRETLAKVELIGGWDNVMISNVSSAGRSRRRRRATRPLCVEPERRSVRDGGRTPAAQSRQRRHGRLRDERGQSRSHSRAPAGHGVQRRRRVRDRRTVAPRTSAPARTRHVPAHPRRATCASAKALTLEQAINKMTALPASRIHLADRGRIAPGRGGRRRDLRSRDGRRHARRSRSRFSIRSASRPSS